MHILPLPRSVELCRRPMRIGSTSRVPGDHGSS
jgi:hypothetical protein